MKSHTHNFAADASLHGRAVAAICIETSQAVVSGQSRKSLMLDPETVRPYGGGAID